jgi:peptidoglycan lytic transglycosylase
MRGHGRGDEQAMSRQRTQLNSLLALAAGLVLLVGMGAEATTSALARGRTVKEHVKSGPKPLPRPKPRLIAAATSARAVKNVPLPRPRPNGNVVVASLSETILEAAPAPARAASSPLVPLPRPRPDGKAQVASLSVTVRPSPGPVALPPSQVSIPPAPAAGISSASISATDLAAVKEAMRDIERGKIDAAHALTRDIHDRVAQKVVEWAILRSPYADDVPFERFVAFIKENPNWPSIELLRRRAEAALWQDGREAHTVLAYFADKIPRSAKGRLVLARALVAEGDRKAATPLVREVWRRDDLTPALEIMVINAFGSMLTHADYKARMDMLLYEKEKSAAMRMAQHLGSTQVALAKARVAVLENASNAKVLLDAVPAAAHSDPGYMFSRIRWLRRHDKIAEAGKLMLSVPNDPQALIDLNQWWVERRYLCRKLLDIGDAKTAYRVARDAVPPPKENYRVDHYFMAGWIALRFLKEPETALKYFDQIPQGLTNPYALARAGYWQGRALEAMGRPAEARKRYRAAAKNTTTYYGQIARGKLGLPDLTLNPPPRLPPSRKEVARAAEILYAADQRDLVAVLMADLGERCNDIALLAALGDVTARHGDGRAMLLLGQGALKRGLPFDYYAYPTVGLPPYKPIGPTIEPTIAYAIARQESGFNQKDISSAKAMGLMQVTPEAGRDTAKKFKVHYSTDRLLHDVVYNMQMGAAELGDLLHYYHGSYVLTFAGYNAGRGRVNEWIERYGDPRNPKVDPIDWIERIPFSETRNYVQRILENLQVYRVRFGRGNRLFIEADLRRGSGIRTN